MAPLKYLLDTHALLWAGMDDEKLGAKAAKAILSASYEQLAIADVTLQEIGLLLHLEKIKTTGSPEKLFEQLLEHVRVLPITLPIAIKAPTLKLPHGDQFDRIITATALAHDIPLITKDANITDSGLVRTIW